MVDPSLNLLETVFALRSPGEPYPGSERLKDRLTERQKDVNVM